DRGQRHQVALAEEDVELARVQPLDDLVVDREMEDGEEVVGVLVDLRSLPLREHVLKVERMPTEPLLKMLGLRSRRRGQVNPGEAVLVKFSEPRLGRRDDDLARAR